MECSPIALFTFKRLDTLQQTIASLQLNKEVDKTDLFVFSDAGRNIKEIEAVSKVRLYLNTISGFKSTSIIESDINKGLANSIINGVTQILETNNSVIVLEDDLVVSTNFLSYMNQGLKYYQNNQKVLSHCGYSSPVYPKDMTDKDCYLTHRSSSWGWATWKDRWDKIDWEMKNYGTFIEDKKQQRDFNRMGSDMTHMLKKQYDGKINSWAIRFCFHQFQNKLFSVHPVRSKVTNIGLNSKEATHTKGMTTRFSTKLDQTSKTDFKFESEMSLNRKIIAQFIKPYSIKTRVWYKIKNLLK